MILVFVRVKEPAKHALSLGTTTTQSKEKLISQGFMMTFLACCGVVMWVGIVGGFNFIMLPIYAAQLGLSTTEVGLLYLVYGSATAISNIHFGRQADRGRRKLLIFAGSIFGAVSFALLLEATSLVQVVILLAALGIGLGMGSPAAAAMIADASCSSRRGETYGIFNTSRMIGVVVGPLIAGMTTDMYGINGTITSFTAIAIAITSATLFIRDPVVPEAIICRN